MATDTKKALVFSILEFLKKSCEDGSISQEDTDSIDVAMQCIGEAFGVDPADPAQQAAYSTKPATLLNIFDIYLKTKAKTKGQASGASTAAQSVDAKPEVSEEDKQKAEELKAAGNRKVSERNYPEAIKLYTEAISLNPSQAVYYGNRAAAYSQQGDHQKALEDAKKAIELDPKYSKGYSRLGHAYFSLEKYDEAVEAYENGLKLDPENATVQRLLQTAKSKVGSVDRSVPSRSAPSAGGLPDLSSLMNNPALMNMAQQMMQSGALDQLMNNPNISEMAQRMMGGGGGGGLAEMMQNPELMNMARQFMGGANNSNNNSNNNNR
ncbi:hypothetical protein BX666DRAFT_2009767 [Dichotomocladium elegans]|nr:hypothetical protein BX666DRAFT_2009767 [Dichotomocladium elegans]